MEIFKNDELTITQDSTHLHFNGSMNAIYSAVNSMKVNVYYKGTNVYDSETMKHNTLEDLARMKGFIEYNEEIPEPINTEEERKKKEKKLQRLAERQRQRQQFKRCPKYSKF